MKSRLLLMCVLACFLLAAGGCGPTRMNISVALDKSFQETYGMNRDVQVDVVVLRGPERIQLEQYSMTRYFENRDSQRSSLTPVSLMFNSKSLEPKVLSADDPHWKDWLNNADCKDAPQVFVLAQLPGTFDVTRDDKPGNLDPRRRIISTCASRGMFDPPPTVRLLIGKDRIWIQQ
jgi:hypothetical protein